MFGRKKQLLARFRNRFGNDPLEEAWIGQTRDRLPAIRVFYDRMEKPAGYDDYSIDDVTWSDLEMDEIFLRINHTQSYIGEQVLYEILRSGRTDHFRKNREWMNRLSESEDTRLELEYRLRGVGKRQESYYLPEFLRNAELLKPGHTWVFRLLQIILAAAVLLAVIFRTFPFFIFLAFSAGTNFITYMVMKQKYDILLSSMGGLGKMLDLCEWCLDRKELMLPDTEVLRQEWQKLKGLRRKLGKFIFARQSSMTGDPTGLLYEYFLGITMIDVTRLSGILGMISENHTAIEELYRFAGRLDAAVSILSFRASLPGWTYPEMADIHETQDSCLLQTPSGTAGIATAGLYHPLLKNPVCNDFDLKARAIITGANASGKSTFMKALAVNAVLALTIDTCCADTFSLPYIKVMTSMAIRDDVVTGESYYVREVRYLKRMLDVIDSGTRTLCIIDEILKGTNQKERLAASEAVLDYIARRPGFCVVATHDLELVQKHKENYDPYYFESLIEEGNVSFTYRIRSGMGGDTNALALLKAFDFPDEILEEAHRLI